MTAARNWRPRELPNPRRDARVELTRMIVDHVEPELQDELLDAVQRLVDLERAAAVHAYENADKIKATVDAMFVGRKP